MIEGMPEYFFFLFSASYGPDGIEKAHSDTEDNTRKSYTNRGTVDSREDEFGIPELAVSNVEDVLSYVEDARIGGIAQIGKPVLKVADEAGKVGVSAVIDFKELKEL